MGKLVPSELDVIGGATTTWPIGPTALELGARYERDLPLDKGDFTQSYADLRARWLGSLAAAESRASGWLRGGDVTGYLMLGWFGYNPAYAARPDNTGRALLRYAGHVALSAWENHLLVGMDATMFTDRRENAVVPSEVDFTFDLGTRVDVFDLHLAYERDMPVDRGGLVQQLLMLYGTWGFEIVRNRTGSSSLPAAGAEDAYRTH